MRTSLKNNEHIILETRLHWLTLVLPFLVTIVLAILLLIYLPKYWYIDFVFLLYFFFKVYERRCNLWAVTNLRIVDEEGVFSRYSKESPLDKINNVSFQQSFMGSIFIISTFGILPLSNVPDIKGVAKYPSQLTLMAAVISFVGLSLCVGLPISLIASKYYLKNTATS